MADAQDSEILRGKEATSEAMTNCRVVQNYMPHGVAYDTFR